MRGKYLFLLLIVAFIVSSSFGNVAYASESKEDLEIKVDLGELGCMELYLDDNGNYVGTTFINNTNSRSVEGTIIKAHLSGNTGGIPNLYELFISWSGSGQISYMVANTIKVTDTSILFPRTFFDDSLSLDCRSTTVGTARVNVFTIPIDVKKVKVKTSGLMVYFNSTGWSEFGNQLNGTLNVN